MDNENHTADSGMTLSLIIGKDADIVAPVEEIVPKIEAEPEAEGIRDQAVGEDPFKGIKRQIDNLFHAFESKLKYDQHKEKIIDDLHHALQDYRQGLIKKYLQRVFTDIIKIVDDIKKCTLHYQNHPDHNEVSQKLLSYIECIASDLEDLFSLEGVVPFTCEGNDLDPARQRVVKKIETEDPEKDKKIAEHLRSGYEWDGRVIRPEMVSVYVKKAPDTGINTSTEEEKIP